jgi:hypothetical protein
MSINVTPIPRLIDLAAPAFTLGTANAAGSAVTAVASDATLLAFDAVAVDAITFGQSGSVGSATVAPRRDHVHAMEAETPTVAASQAEMEAASSTTVFDTPGRTQYHPGVAKVWCHRAGDGTLSSPDYGVSTVTDTGTGNATINFTTAFTTNVYSVLGGFWAASWELSVIQQNLGTGSVQVLVMNSANGTLTDANTTFAAFGDQ